MICFQLLDKTTGEPANLPSIDNDMCKFFGVTPHPEYYYRSWYDIVGLCLASGYSYETIKQRIPEYSDIVDYLEKHYNVNCWAQTK